jgi:hypothetical protein
MYTKTAAKSAARALFGLVRSTQSGASGAAQVVSTFASEFKTEWQRLSLANSRPPTPDAAGPALPTGSRREFGLTILPR